MASSATITSSASDTLFQLSDLDRLYDKAVTDACSLTSYLMAVAAVGALLYVCVKAWRQWGQGNPIVFYEFLRPFTVALLLSNFYVVPEFINLCCEPLVVFTASLKDASYKEYQEKSDKVYSARLESVRNIGKTVTAAEDGTQEESWSLLGAIFDIVDQFNPLTNLTFLLRKIRYDMAVNISMFLCKLVSIALYVFMIVTVEILIILAPVVLTLAIFPSFDHVLKQWICRYINVMLWIPMANIVGYVIQQLYITVFYDKLIRAYTSSGSNAASVYSSGGDGYLILISLLACIMYCMVPKLSNWILDGNGSGLIGGAVSNVFKTAASAGASATGAAVAAGTVTAGAAAA